MTYAPPWPEWDAKTRAVIAELNASLDDDVRDAVRDLAGFVGGLLRVEFANVDRHIVGWVAMRTASHLGALAAQNPDVGAQRMALIGLLAGEYIEAGDV
jgi:hypothetical protein